MAFLGYELRPDIPTNITRDYLQTVFERLKTTIINSGTTPRLNKSGVEKFFTDLGYDITRQTLDKMIKKLEIAGATTTDKNCSESELWNSDELVVKIEKRFYYSFEFTIQLLCCVLVTETIVGMGRSSSDSDRLEILKQARVDALAYRGDFRKLAQGEKCNYHITSAFNAMFPNENIEKYFSNSPAYMYLKIPVPKFQLPTLLMKATLTFKFFHELLSENTIDRYHDEYYKSMTGSPFSLIAQLTESEAMTEEEAVEYCKNEGLSDHGMYEIFDPVTGRMLSGFAYNWKIFKELVLSRFEVINGQSTLIVDTPLFNKHMKHTSVCSYDTTFDDSTAPSRSIYSPISKLVGGGNEFATFETSIKVIDSFLSKTDENNMSKQSTFISYMEMTLMYDTHPANDKFWMRENEIFKELNEDGLVISDWWLINFIYIYFNQKRQNRK